MLDLAIIQNQSKVIFGIITKNLFVQESPQVGKYGVIALQFLLHSKTESQWNDPSDKETEHAFQLLLSSLVDKRDKVSKQAQKSLCVIFQNKMIERLIRPLSTF